MSTKMQQIIEWRRAKVMELLSKGESNQSTALVFGNLMIVQSDYLLLENMPTKNMKLLMPNVLIDDDVVEIPTRLDVNTPIFKIAFADSSSNAKSNPLIKFSFTALLPRR